MSVCAACGRLRPQDHKTCPHCGAAPARRGARGKGAPPATEERKQATILFCDVCGSTARIRDLDVEQARDYLAPATQLMREAVQAYGGSVYRVDGDGVLAVFGAPLGQEDQALRACLAALEIQHRAPGSVGNGPPLVVRAGINTGEVIAWKDTDSQADRIDGKTVHYAKRLQEFAQPGTVVLGCSTQRLVAPEVDARSLGVHDVRDVGSIELFELTGGTRRSAVDPLARRRQLGPLVGRQHTLSALGVITQQVRAGRLRIVGLRGEAGIGKSRVALEYAQQLRAGGFQYCWVGGRAYATNTPYAVVADLVRVLMGLPEADAARQRETARAVVARWPETQRQGWAAAEELLDIAERDAAAPALTPAQRQRHITETVRWLIAERAALGPVLVVVDDIYLADRESQRLLEALMRRLEELPVLVCATYRQDFVHRWANASWFTEHWIGPLPTDEMASHTRALLGPHESLDAVVAALVERADGNPFFLEQMAMTLVDGGTLVGAPGAYRAAHAHGELRLPASIAAVIGARVDRLAPPAKAALEAASIVGRPICGAVIGAMQQSAADAAQAHLHAAQSSGLLSPSEAVGEGQACFEFRHGLVQEAVAAALTRPRRKALHRSAFKALRLHFASQLAEHASTLAHHAYDGEAWAEAAAFALQSMARSIAHSAYRDALRVFALGLDASQRLADPAARGSSELSLRMKVLGAQLPLGQIDDIVANLERAEAITQELGDMRRRAGVLLQLAVVLWTRGSYRQGLGAAALAVDTAAAAENPSLRMAAMQARMLLHHGLGLYDEVLATAADIEREFAAELGEGKIMPGWAVIPGVNIRVFLADVLWRMARIDEAQRACDAAYAELARQEHAFSRVLVDFEQGEVWKAQGRHADACRLLAQTLQCCKVNDLPTMYPPILAMLAGSMAHCGQAVEAVSLLERAIADQVPLAGGRYNAYYFPMNLALALAAAQRREEAIAAAAQARAAAVANEQGGNETDALVLQAELEVAAGRTQEALAHFEEALAMARARGMEFDLRRCRAGIDRAIDGPLAVERLVRNLERLYGSDVGD